MGDEKMQKIAIRNQEIFARYADRFDDATITAPPYNFTLVPIDDDVDPDTVRIEDFTVTPDGTVWDRARYDQRVAEKTKQDKRARYHACIQQKIRSRYSLDEELAILRKRDSDPIAFRMYNAYCEQCKRIARGLFPPQ